MPVKYFSTLSILFFFNILSSQCPEYIHDFHNIENENHEINFIQRYKNINQQDVQPYLIAINMKQSEYASLPWKKIQIFNYQKKMLDNFIKENPYNVHARYMRYIIQKKSPSFLGYNKDYQKDKHIIIEEIDDIPQCLKNYILTKINSL